MFDSNDNENELFKSLQHLKHNKHEVVVFHVVDRETEIAFQFDDKPIEFIDLENQSKIKLNPGEVKAYYTASMEKFHREIKMKCNQYKIDYIEADVKKGFDVILQTYLIKRTKMR